MRVLLLKRQPLGGINSLTEALVPALRQCGVEARIEEASSWIPNETDTDVCRRVTKKLRSVGKEFDLVHAFGYRAAWACSDAYNFREAWVYTAYDMPKTTRRTFIDKLNEAQLGFCSSFAVREALFGADAKNLVVRYPGVSPGLGSYLGVEDAKRLFGLAGNAKSFGCLGRLIPERGFKSAVEAMRAAREMMPDLHFLIGGEGPEEDRLRAEAGPNVHFLGRVRNTADFYQAIDLLVVPSTRASFSMVAAEAMSLGVPVLLRETGGLTEMVERGHTGSFFGTDAELAPAIADALSSPLAMEAISHAAKLHAESAFSIEEHANAISRSYKSVLD